MKNSLLTIKQCAKYFLILAVFVLCNGIKSAESATINEFTISPVNPKKDDYIYVAVQGLYWGGHSYCAPGAPSIDLSNNVINVQYTEPSDPGKCITPGIVGIPGDPWTDVIPIWQSIGQLDVGTYQLVISYVGGVMLRTSFTVTQERGLGGINSGLMPRRIHCRNLTTGKKVTIKSDVESWNCAAAGLRVKPGDKIEQRIIGFVKESSP
jgi:hypothetical protein